MRHPFHAICPYFAIFPESFVEDAVLSSSRPGDLIFDPFVGRGTTVFQSLLMGRRAIGMDVNPVAFCVASSKADPPRLLEILARIDELSSLFDGSVSSVPGDVPVFFDHCFSYLTLRQVYFARQALDWRGDRIDRFVAALILGVLHGESARSSRYLSNQMPRTISTKPEYSIRWWKTKGLRPPRRDLFATVREEAKTRYSRGVAPIVGEVLLADARTASERFAEHKRNVSLVVTSPPYLNVTDYGEDQWLRLWWLGGTPYPVRGAYADGRHRNEADYWQFLEDVWKGSEGLLKDRATLIVRIGGRMSRELLVERLFGTLTRGLSSFCVSEPHSTSSSDVVSRETARFKGRSVGVEHDFAFKLVRRG